MPSPVPAALSTASSAVWQRLVRSADIDAHARAQPDWELRYEQLASGRFDGLVHHIQLPGARLVHEFCNLATRQRGRFVDGSYGFALGDAPMALAIFNGQRVERDAMMLGRAGELDLCTPNGYTLIAVVVDEALLNPLWLQMYGKEPSAWMQSQLVVPTRSAATADALRGRHRRALADAAALLASEGERAGAEVAMLHLRDGLLIEWFEALPAAVDASALPNAQARKRLVDRACELMLDHSSDPLSMLEVCRRVGASRRKLNYCFQEALGTTPVKYLRAVRLNGVRRELLAGADAIQDVAARWGFWHLSQFARDYRRQFGELPSRTRAGR
jgi:AraC family ethanolamine operon transcriptional activator